MEYDIKLLKSKFQKLDFSTELSKKEIKELYKKMKLAEQEIQEIKRRKLAAEERVPGGKLKINKQHILIIRMIENTEEMKVPADLELVVVHDDGEVGHAVLGSKPARFGHLALGLFAIAHEAEDVARPFFQPLG